MKTNHKITASLTGVGLLLALGLGVSFWAFSQIKQASDAREHTSVVIHNANALMAALIDAETGQRGYLLTGDDAFLEPYLAVRNRIRGHLKELRQQTLNRAAHKHLDILEPLLDAKLGYLSENIALRRNNNMAVALANVRSSQGKQLMDSIRGELRGFIQIEEDALAHHEAEYQSNMRYLFAIIVSACLVLLLGALAFVYWIYRESQQRLKNLVHLERQHLLEIQEATNKELQRTNDILQISEAKIFVTLNSIGDAVIATDAEACVTLLNPVAEQLTGWTQAEALGHTVYEIFHIINQETRQSVSVPVTITLTQGTLQGLAKHTLLIDREGNERAIADSCAPIRDGNKQVVGAVLVFRDVTAREQAEDELRRLNRELRAITNCNQILMRAENEKTLLNDICRVICDEAGYRMVWVGYAEHDKSQTIRPIAWAGLEDGYLAQAGITWADTERGRGPCGTAIRSGDSACIQDFTADPLAAPWLMASLRQGYRSNIALPLKDENANTFGVLSIYSSTPNAFTPEEIRLLKELSNDVSFGIRVLRVRKAREMAEEALLKGGALQVAIFNSANFSSIATDAKGVIQIFNVGAERMLGYSAVDVVNKITPADISDPQEVIVRAKALSVELATPITPGFEALVFKASRGIEDIYELTYIRKDGSRFPAVVSVTALRDEQDSIIGYLSIGTDNTVRKQIEADQKQLAQRLRDYQFYTRSLFESNIDALMTTDPSGIITDVNKQMETLTDCTRDELIGAPFKNYFTDPSLAENSIKLVLSEKKVTNYELTVRARDGKETVVSYNATTFYDRDRKLQGVFAAARDVTERKRLDQVLQEQNAELVSARSVAEKANLAKSDFLSSMSHELRSPLNAILGFAQLMESAAPSPTDSQKESIDQILQAGWHLLNLINEILDLARIESGKVSLSREPVSMAEVMTECQAMMEPQAKLRGIRMTFPRFDDEIPVFVKADRTRLKQIIINLLSNAIKYNKEHGSVVVSCTASTSERIRIRVADTGVGLSPDKMAQLFQPFNRLGQEGGGVAGTGIGLVVTKRLAELMEGVLGVESTVGVGSVFWCELALSEMPQLIVPGGESLAAIPLPLSLPDGPQKTVLYVEDNPANMKLVEQILARHPDIRLLTAVNGTLGIACARASVPEVILMDINLPGISGTEALKILRTDPVTAHIPVIALSANAMPRDIAKGLEVGFFRYLTKPIKVNELMETLNLAMDSIT